MSLISEPRDGKKSETYETFLRLYADNKPYEDIAIQKALQHFNQSREKPLYVARTQDKKNYKTMLYDAELRNGEESVKLEVKTDHRSEETGNFFIEHTQYGKDSGIATTTADYYIITDTTNYYLINVNSIFEVLEGCSAHGVLRTAQLTNGDGMTTKGYPIKKEWLLEGSTALA